ncbi:hypothetical protein QEN19_002719 [Hanseniaspora menglaensis]
MVAATHTETLKLSSKAVQPQSNNENLDDIDETDQGGQSILLGIISQLKPGADLSRITLPTFILERKSMLERITNQLQQPDMILAAKEEKESIDKLIGVVKWYLSGWHIAPKAVKKPLNPVIGEHFQCFWDLPNKQQAFYISEQTSHHPPKSAYFYMIPESNIRVDGIVFPKSKFLGNSSAAMMEGLGVLQFLDINDPNTGNPEKYTFTQPNIYARGILFGKMRIELGDHMIITGPNHVADIDFKTKGFVSGTYDVIEGTIKELKTNKIVYEISGKWNDVIYIKEAKKGAKKNILLDVHQTDPLPPQIRPLEEQGALESRKLWEHVLSALGKRNHEAATDEKFKIEEEQRLLAKQRAEQDTEYEPKLFRKVKGQELEYYFYKDIPAAGTAEEKVAAILESAPILPGQSFTKGFNAPAKSKYKLNKSKQLQQ